MFRNLPDRVGIGAIASLIVCAAATCATAQEQAVEWGKAPTTAIYHVALITMNAEKTSAYFQSQAEARITTEDQRSYQVDLTHISRFDPVPPPGEWIVYTVDSVDPAMDNLPEDISLRFTIDAMPGRLNDLVPDDIPDPSFGLLTEYITVFGILSSAPWEQLTQVGDSVRTDGFTMTWKRPRKIHDALKTSTGGTWTLEKVLDGVATLHWKADELDVALLHGYDKLQISRGKESLELELKVDVATRQLIESRTLTDRITLNVTDEVQGTKLPPLDEIQTNPEKGEFVTNRMITIRKVAD